MFSEKTSDHQTDGLNKWKNLLLENAITPIQQYGYTTGKNATDSAMIIDAMDILYSNKVEGGTEELEDWMNALRHLDFFEE